MSIQTQNSALRQVALVQARQLREHADKAPHNDFVDHFLNSPDFQESAILEEKVMASLARILPRTVVSAEGRFALLQGCFEAAVGGSLAANPGALAPVMAKLTLEALSKLKPAHQQEMSRIVLSRIADQDKTDARLHAGLAVRAAEQAQSENKQPILNNALVTISGHHSSQP